MPEVKVEVNGDVNIYVTEDANLAEYIADLCETHPDAESEVKV